MPTPSQIIAEGERLQTEQALKNMPTQDPGFPPGLWDDFKAKMRRQAIKVGLDPDQYPALK